MATAIIIGDGPGGLSAALFLAKNGMDTTVFGQDQTAMHYAMLYNYLGIPQILGSDFQRTARLQVAEFGADLQDKLVVAVDHAASGFQVTDEDGQQHQADYLIIAEGKAAKLAKALGLAENERGVQVDRYGRATVPRLFIVGRATDTGRSQAIISAGQGATAALEILSEVHGKDFRDFDEPPPEG